VASAVIGREREQRVLQAALDSGEAELVAVHGRRRVGKTFLVREFFGDLIRFELTGTYRGSSAQQLRNFADALVPEADPIAPPAPPRDWQEAFRRLRAFVERASSRAAKMVLFFDELPWLASRRSGFLPAFEHFWNAWAVKQRHVLVVVSGSASAWMVQRLLGAKGGLHNRVTRRIRLEPFVLPEAEAYLRSRRVRLTRYAVTELYAALGGIPYYLRQIDPGESPAAAIDRLCFAPDGPLREEFANLYASLFEHAERHENVVRVLAGKRRGLSRAELIEAAGLTTGGRVSTLTDELIESGFVLRMPQIGREAKDALYRLVDEYSLFYLSFVEKFRGTGTNVWTSKRGGPTWRAWSGYAFEGICLKHIGAIKRALGIEAVETTASSWFHRPTPEIDQGVQIDLVIDRKDATINLCEMKFSEAEFVVDKRYAAELTRKRDTFRRATGTRKSLFTTLIATMGLRPNEHSRSAVDQVLDLEALFR
jgi:hypothetical protein